MLHRKKARSDPPVHSNYENMKKNILMGFFLQNNNCQKYPREIALMLVRKLHQFWGLSTIIIYHYGKKIHDVAIYA